MNEREIDERDFCFPVGEYVAEELEARGWSYADAAARLDGNTLHHQAWLEFLCCADLWFSAAIIFSDEEAELLSRLFGTSKEIWLNLHNSFVASRKRIAELNAARASLAAIEKT